MVVSTRVRETLEFDRVLQLAAGHAVSELGRRRVLRLEPMADAALISAELDRLAEMYSITAGDANFSPPDVPVLTEQIARLSKAGVVLEADEIVAFGRLLDGAQAVRGYVLRREDRLPSLGEMAGRLTEFEQLQHDIGRTFDENNEVRSSASPTLGRLRRDARGLRERLEKRLENMAAGLKEQGSAGENFVTLRQERYVLAILRSEMQSVPGIIQGESGSGNTLFIEPEQVVGLNNSLREVELDIRREIFRILAALSAQLAEGVNELRVNVEMLAELDSLYARARFGQELNCRRPKIGDGVRLKLARARHPLLASRPERTVPLDLEMAPGERTLLVSGPNAGGKTVMLKTVGLAALMTQCGMFPPAADGSSLPVFANVIAAIGDEQSIDKDLSSFSGHVIELKEALDHGGERSLLLLDEIGAGTDPAEGAALAAAVLERLTRRGCLTLSTTHYGELKQLYEQVPGLVNGSLEFDPERLEPTFVFRKGLPGRSYGLEIAANMGLDAATLQRAREFMGGEALHRESFLARLEERQKELDRLVESARERDRKSERRAGEMAAERRRLEDRAGELDKLEKTFDRRMDRKVREALLEARKEVENVIAQLRREYESGRERAARRARREIEERVRELESAAAEPAETQGRAPAEGVDPSQLSRGDRVRLPAMDLTGEVVGGPDGAGKFTVLAGRVRLTVSPADMEKIGRGERGGKKEAGFEFTPAEEKTAGDEAGKSRLDIRGLRPEEVGLELDRFLTGAMLEELGEVVVLHGKGTGALRNRVAELLKHDRRVESFRPGERTEGGAGVTVVSLAG